MVSQGTFSIGGIASGLDTASIVQQLLQLERRPMIAIEQRQQQHRKADEAWGQIVTRLSTLRTATNKLNDPAWLQKTASASSTNDAVARATASGGASPGSLAFTVNSLATTHQLAVGGTYTSADTFVGQGQIILQRGGEEITATLGEGATLSDAARALNDLDGISARVLRVADGVYRLIATADSTGERAAFTATSTVDGIDADQNHILTAGEDASISIGDLTIFRSSNTVDDLIDGVSIRLTGTGATTVEVRQDLDEGVKQVKGFVDGLNALLNQLATATKSSPEQGSRGPLNSDPLARDLAMRLRSSLSSVTGDGTYRTLSQIGVSLTRNGQVTLDENKLREALSADPQGVAGLLGRSSSATDPRVEVSAVGQAQAGAYQVQVDTAARIAAVTGAVYTPPNGDPKVFSITTASGQTVSVTVQAGDSLEAAIGRINAALLEANVGTITATERNGAIHLSADRAGTTSDFTVQDSGELGLDDVVPGASAQGTISDGTDTWAFTGSGRSLSVAEGPARGLVLRIPTGVTGDLGTVSIGEGLGSVMDRVLRTAEGANGSIARARSAVTSRIEAGKASIERFEQRLEIRERSIRRQFTALESAMAQFNAQGNWLASQLGMMTQG